MRIADLRNQHPLFAPVVVAACIYPPAFAAGKGACWWTGKKYGCVTKLFWKVTKLRLESFYSVIGGLMGGDRELLPISRKNADKVTGFQREMPGFGETFLAVSRRDGADEDWIPT
ncbi:hypothetical protein [Stappia indica]|uniref:hypothetical protein n=1 Tax=Stappia indica TaxID=538381 RepID=UPI001CD427AA|nr:hypothetical protein [Stappia indica]MCA1300609.1 hypothetical protein [Stappia indica]